MYGERNYIIYVLLSFVGMLARNPLVVILVMIVAIIALVLGVVW